MLGTLLYMVQRPRHKKIGAEVLESFEMWCWRRMEKIKWSEKVINEQILERIGEKKYPTLKSKLDRSYSENKLPPS